jgi:hypothetical protein
MHDACMPLALQRKREKGAWRMAKSPFVHVKIEGIIFLVYFTGTSIYVDILWYLSRFLW